MLYLYSQSHAARNFARPSSLFLDAPNPNKNALSEATILASCRLDFFFSGCSFLGVFSLGVVPMCQFPYILYGKGESSHPTSPVTAPGFIYRLPFLCDASSRTRHNKQDNRRAEHERFCKAWQLEACTSTADTWKPPKQLLTPLFSPAGSLPPRPAHAHASRRCLCWLGAQEENAKLCDVFMRWLLGEAGVRFPRRREYELSESRRVPNTESLADRLRCCLQVTDVILGNPETSRKEMDMHVLLSEPTRNETILVSTIP